MSTWALPKREARRVTIPERYLPKIATGPHPAPSIVHQQLVTTRHNCAKCCWVPAAARRLTEELKVRPHPALAVATATRMIPTVRTSSNPTSISASPPIWSTSIPRPRILPSGRIPKISSTPPLPDTKPNHQTKVIFIIIHSTFEMKLTSLQFFHSARNEKEEGQPQRKK